MSLDAAFGYLANIKPECKVVGVMMVNSVLNTGNVGIADVIPTVTRVMDAAGAQFILQMIETASDDESNTAVHAAGLSFMLLACSYDVGAHRFNKLLPQLLAVLERLKRDTSLQQYIDCIGMVATVMTRKERKLATATLLTKLMNTASPLMVLRYLQTFARVAVARGEEDSSIVELTQEQAGVLRGAVIRGLHGAAPQALRDGTLNVLCQLLTSRSQPLTAPLALSPSWTVASPASADSAGAGTGKQESPGSLAQVLCSVVRGELQLLCDEALFLASSTAEAVAERFTLPVPPRQRPPPAGAPDVTSTTATEAATPTNSSSADSSDQPTAASFAPPNPANDVAYFRTRSARAVAMLCTCLRLLECFLELLIGGQDSSSEEVPLWSFLPGEALLQIKRSLYGAVDDLLTFAKDCGEQLRSWNGIQAEQHFLSSNMLRNAVCSAVDTLSVFVVQDTQLMATYIAHIPALLLSSHLCVASDGAVTVNSGTSSSTLVSSVSQLGEGTLDLKSLLSEHVTDTPSEVDESTPAVGVDSELVLHLAGPLQELLGTLASAGTAGGDIEAEGLVLDGAAQDTLCDCLPQLLPRLLHLIQLAAEHVVSGTGTEDSAALVHGVAEMCSLFAGLVALRETRHPGELRILRTAEGDQADLVLYGVHAQRYREVAVTLQGLCERGVEAGSAHCKQTINDFAHILL
jgi:hypothetical protein